MEHWNTQQMTPFDCSIATQTLQLTKLLIPYLPPQTQRLLAIYVKFMEFQTTISSFHAFQKCSHSTQDILQELKPYMPASAYDSMEQFQNLMSMMDVFHQFQDSGESDMNFDPMTLMKTMFSDEESGCNS